ncbi:tetratricopeptide repeat protein, partial [Amylibacter sp.]|nr:tetratricopeptide repeat protein [Amylibacter sp.]
LQEQGKLDEAITSYNKALSLKPDYADAYYNMGVTFKEQGKLEEAIEEYNKALELKPDYADAYYNMGNALKDQGKLEQAIEAYEKALALKPDYADAYNNMGNSLKDQGKLDEAIASYDKALALKPDYADAYNNMGAVLQDQGKLEEAIASYDKALALKPDYADAYNNMGAVLQEQGKLEQAIEAYEKALALKPDYAEAYNNMGNALKDQGKLEQAIEAYKKALALKPDYAEVHNNMGTTLQEKGKLEQAIEAYDKALALKPDYADAYNNMGNALKAQVKLDEAIAAYNKALSIKPNYAKAYNNMGATLTDQGKLDEAIAAYNKALSLKPDYAEAYTNMGKLHLLQGNFKKAFELLEYRWLVKNDTIGEALKTNKPEWQGGKERLFVWKEQGIGDEVMFSSLLIDAAKQASSLMVECDHRLLPIYKRSFPSNIKFIDDRKKVAEQDYDSHLAIGSLLKHFRSDKSDFEKSAAGWLKADEPRTNNYRNSLLSKPSSKLIGLSWFTKATNVNSHFRNVDVEQLSDHLHGLPFIFVSLQYGLSKEELAEINSKLRINILSVDELDLFNDIDGLASLIAACDSVISVDNINVHLAGALGVDTRVMLPKVSDERWGLASEQSYWYDSLKLYRQEKLGDWSVTLKALKEEFSS